MIYYKSNWHRERNYFYILILMGIWLFKGTIAHAQTQNREEHHVNLNNGLSTEGAWSATIKEDKITIRFKADDDESFHNSSSFPLNDFKDLPVQGAGNFSLSRDAGTMAFTGRFEGKEGNGHYKFTGNKDFAAFLKKEGVDKTDDPDLMAYFMVNVKQSYVQMLKRNGYNQLSKNDLLPLAALDVNEGYINSIKGAGFTDIGVRNLIPFRALRIDADYINEIRKAGYAGLTESKIIAFKAQGIDGAYIAEVKNSIGKGPGEKSEDDGNEKVKMKNETEAGNKAESSLDNISAFKALNIDAAYVNSIKGAGLTDLSSNDFIAFKANGVTADYIKSIRELGFADVSASNIIAIKAQGIKTYTIKEYQDLGLESLTLNDVIAGKATGTTPSFIRSMKEKGHHLKSINKYIQLRVALN